MAGICHLQIYLVAVSALCKIGGRNLKDSARRMLDRVLNNSLMSKFNMKGGGPLQKEAFEKTAVFTVIRGRHVDAVFCMNDITNMKDPVELVLQPITNLQAAYTSLNKDERHF
ncbi:hypothetical protein IRJ41_000602 [Triplophysa rosa]|uniref:Uncharacterized protein n=1 Tax=Triplophysa rosa TaxID=992332 RepID=A0A9W7THJ5_TRIRA|nr:hypothetical protein IRJ41_000602 [Triplophysa rosa]